MMPSPQLVFYNKFSNIAVYSAAENGQFKSMEPFLNINSNLWQQISTLFGIQQQHHHHHQADKFIFYDHLCRLRQFKFSSNGFNEL